MFPFLIFFRLSVLTRNQLIRLLKPHFFQTACQSQSGRGLVTNMHFQNLPIYQLFASITIVDDSCKLQIGQRSIYKESKRARANYIIACLDGAVILQEKRKPNHWTSALTIARSWHEEAKVANTAARARLEPPHHQSETNSFSYIILQWRAS